MTCYEDGKTCSCNLDDVSKGECPRDPFRALQEFDEEHSLLLYLNGHHEARTID